MSKGRRLLGCQGNRPLARIKLAQGAPGAKREEALSHWCQLNVSWAVETAATQTKPADAGFKNLDFSLVRPHDAAPAADLVFLAAISNRQSLS